MSVETIVLIYVIGIIINSIVIYFSVKHFYPRDDISVVKIGMASIIWPIADVCLVLFTVLYVIVYYIGCIGAFIYGFFKGKS